jgi:predicted polyphosphate/ATP-dependent NAD kinase
MRAVVRHANEAAPPRRLGLLVNPVAGMGGPVGLKGTDGPDILARAIALGARPTAQARAARALGRLTSGDGEVRVIAGPGPMGADVARAAGMIVEETGTTPVETGPADSVAAIRRMVARGVDLILFAGGDGTARLVMETAPSTPTLGVPTGVKMHSGVFATTPEAAGEMARRIMREPPDTIRWRSGEVMDVDEEALRQGRIEPRLHGTATTPVEPTLMQHRKARATGDDQPALAALARRMAATMAPGTVHLLGCGLTMRGVKRALGGEGTLLGVDAALDGRLIATDLDEARILRLIATAPAAIWASVTGGQGFLFGRGNQQIGPAVLRRVGRANVTIIAGEAKLIALDPARLLVDTGDLEVDRMLAGYHRVHTAPDRSMMMRVA